MRHLGTLGEMVTIFSTVLLPWVGGYPTQRPATVHSSITSHGQYY